MQKSLNRWAATLYIVAFMACGESQQDTTDHNGLLSEYGPSRARAGSGQARTVCEPTDRRRSTKQDGSVRVFNSTLKADGRNRSLGAVERSIP